MMFHVYSAGTILRLFVTSNETSDVLLQLPVRNFTTVAETPCFISDINHCAMFPDIDSYRIISAAIVSSR